MPLTNLTLLLIALYGGIAILTILGVAFLIRSFYYSKKYVEQKERRLLQEKETARLQIILLEKNNHNLSHDLDQAELRSRLYEEQTAAQAEKIFVLEEETARVTARLEQLQKEVMASALQLERKNDILQALREKLHQPGLNMDKLIHKEQQVDDDFKEYRASLKNIHPGFYTSLHEKAVQKLTPLDEKYCALIYMKLSNKQIASLLNIEPRSIQMTKYRLKQKFGLGKDDSLDVYIRQII
ncbi:hypothetical protein EG028_24200 [Chitinophaga barathri]|uniref:HTH luxR-type domain-containing protein n=2 Tax=Chitinophaga barathri TaxID=1647451 RepID=A0A3N4MFE9_9BACT|nr:hypothetical protein EG028_24200 [Chitinophaga barathri]